MNREQKSGTTIDLAASFTRAWQIRFTAIILLVACLCVNAASIIVDSLQLSPAQNADSLMGNADGYIEVPGSAPLGLNGTTYDTALKNAVTSAGGVAPTIDYIDNLRIDSGDTTSYLLRETANPSADTRRFRLDSGSWPTRMGETVVSAAAVRSWPNGSSVSFFHGLLRLRVVGVYSDVFHAQAPGFIVPSGTWSSLHTIPTSVAATLDETAMRDVRWDAGGDGRAILTTVTTIVHSFSKTKQQQAGIQGLTLTTRSDIESTHPTRNLPWDLTRFGTPLIAGVIGGLLGGAFLRRIRHTLWTVGVPYRQTAGSALLATISSTGAGAIIGCLVGVLLGLAARSVLAGIATQPLGPIISLPLCALAIPIGVIGAIAGVGVTGRQRRSRAMTDETQRRALDRHLYRVATAIVILSIGIFVGNGADGANPVIFSAILIALAILIAIVPFLLAGIGRIKPKSFASLLALRKFAAERRANTFIVIAIAALQVVGFSYSILVTTDIAQVNDQTESLVPPGQIMFQPTLDSQNAIDAARHDFEQRLGLANPVIEIIVAVSSERDDGGTLAVPSADDVERVTGVTLSAEQRAFLERGGTFVTKPISGSNLRFPADGTFRGGVMLPARQLRGLDPSFHNIDGFILISTAKKTGLPLTTQAQLVYTETTAKQVAGAKTAAVALNLNPSFVQVYQAPDVLEPPLRIAAIMVLLSFIAGTVLLFTAASQTRSLRPDFSGLRAIGIGPGFMATVVAVRMILTFALATVLSVVVTLIGLESAFQLGRLSVPLRIPVVPSAAMIIALAVFSAVAALIVTRRLRNVEWLN